eukprot:scaffold80655_cov20-Tisochrysis_lutea.AAC.1
MPELIPVICFSMGMQLPFSPAGENVSIEWPAQAHSVALHMVLAKCVVSFTALHKTGCSEHMVLAKCAVSFTALHKTGCSEHMDPAQNRRFHPLHCAQCAHLRSPPSQSEVVECAGEWGRGGGRKRQLQCQRA